MEPVSTKKVTLTLIGRPKQWRSHGGLWGPPSAPPEKKKEKEKERESENGEGATSSAKIDVLVIYSHGGSRAQGRCTELLEPESQIRRYYISRHANDPRIALGAWRDSGCYRGSFSWILFVCWLSFPQKNRTKQIKPHQIYQNNAILSTSTFIKSNHLDSQIR